VDACLAQDFPDWDRGLLWAGAAAWALQRGQYQAALEAEQKALKTRYPLAAQAWINLARWEHSRQLSPPTWLQSDQAAAMPDLWLQAWVHALLAAQHSSAATGLLEKSISRSQNPSLLKIQLLGGLYEQAGDYLKALTLYHPHTNQPEIAQRQVEVLKNLGQTAEAAALLKSLLAQTQSESQDKSEKGQALLRWSRLHSQYLLCLTSMGDPHLAAEKAIWANRYRPSDAPLPLLITSPKSRLRLGYLAPDFGSHSIYPLITRLFAGHDRAQFEVYAYAGQTRSDAATAHLQANGVHWRDVHGQTPRQIAAGIQNDQIDILIDSSGHTSLHLLPVFYYRAAPIQISGLCFNGSTGLPECGYQLTDAICSPAKTDTDLPLDLDQGEKPLLLSSWLFWFPPQEAIPLSAPQGTRLCAPKLGCAHHPGRLSIEICRLWAQLLNKHPDAQLWLKHRCFASPDTQAVFRQRFAQWGIHPDRLKFAGASGYLDYLAFYNQLSLALDPFPYHGGLTSAEALWMGVPLLNLQGPMQGGLSLLSQVGHPEWSAASAADFETQAAELLQTPWGLEERKNLRRACEAAPFAQADLLLRELEQQVLTLAQKHLLPSA
jgi:predicted O-linked N-acetylglucosamine transferase (SPINDLY family)